VVEGERWHLPRQLLMATLYGAISEGDPPKLNDGICEDIGLGAEERAAVEGILSESLAQLKEIEHSHLEIRTGEDGNRYVHVQGHIDEAQANLREMRESLDREVDQSQAGLVMIAVEVTLAFRKPGQELELHLEKAEPPYEGFRMVELRNGHESRSSGMNAELWVTGDYFHDRYGHLIDLEALGWPLAKEPMP